MRKTASRLRFPVVITTAFVVIAGYYLWMATPSNLDLLFDIHGNTRVSPIYLVKQFREHMSSLFVIGEIDTASWHVTLAQKRFTEAQILKDHNLDSLAQAEIQRGKDHQAKAATLLTAIEGRTDTNYFREQYQLNQTQLESLEQQ